MRDKIYKKPLSEINRFSFSVIVARVFDDMLKRSIPFYKETLLLSAGFVKSAAFQSPQIYDLGCSTGNFLKVLKDALQDEDFYYTGIDSSEAMIKRAEKKKIHLQKNQHKQFAACDILDFQYKKADVFVINYVLQFIEEKKRKSFLKQLYKTLKPKGILILSEKISEKEIYFSKAYLRAYYNFKRKNKYSDIEISQKDKALKDFLRPLSAEENIRLLQTAGFKKVSIFFRWCNFVSIIAVK